MPQVQPKFTCAFRHRQQNVTHVFYGIDTPEREQLMASQHSVQQMADIIGVDSLAFISIDGLYRAVGEAKRDSDAPQYCDACFTGEYPIPLVDRDGGGAPKQLSLLTERD